jgi:hypothetical protein
MAGSLCVNRRKPLNRAAVFLVTVSFVADRLSQRFDGRRGGLIRQEDKPRPRLYEVVGASRKSAGETLRFIQGLYYIGHHEYSRAVFTHGFGTNTNPHRPRGGG